MAIILEWRASVPIIEPECIRLSSQTLIIRPETYAPFKLSVIINISVSKSDIYVNMKSDGSRDWPTARTVLLWSSYATKAKPIDFPVPLSLTKLTSTISPYLDGKNWLSAWFR